MALAPYPGMLSPTAPGPGWTPQGTWFGSQGQGWYPPGYTGEFPLLASGGAQPPTGLAPGSITPLPNQNVPTRRTLNWPGTNVPVNPGNPYASQGAAAPPSTASGSSALTPGPVSGYSAPYGGVPSAPNPIGTGSDAILGNLGNLGNIYNLATGAGTASGAGASANLNAALPGASGALGTALGNTNSLLGGNLDPLTLAQAQEDAAQRGVNIGAPGSPNVDAGYLRALGLTHIGLQNQGLSNLGSLIGMSPRGPQFDPSSMMVTPAQQQLAQILSNYLAAAPNPGAAAAANLNSLLSGMNRGGGAGRMSTPTDPTAGMGGGVGALGAGFGTLGRTGATTPPTLQGPLEAAASGSSDPSQDPTWWMSEQDQQNWNSMSPDQQYEEALMGYPSFFPDQSVTVPGSDALTTDYTGDTAGNYNIDTSGETDMSNLYDETKF